MARPRRLRLLRHMACTGGTLIARCLGTLGEVAVISEVSPAGLPQPPRYEPLAPLAQLFNSYPRLVPDEAALAALLGRQLLDAHDLCAAAGRQLVVREHTHADWMGPHAPLHASLAPALAGFDEIIPALTLRHPFSSFTALVRNGWQAGIGGYRGYCERYLAFLDDAGDAPGITYEAFCEAPLEQLGALAEALDLPMPQAMPRDWSRLRLTGHSGRAKDEDDIRTLPLLSWNPEIERELSRLPEHRELCRRMGYPHSLAAHVEEQNRLALLHAPDDETAARALERVATWRRANKASNGRRRGTV